jgi:predicted amino acid racemase
VTRPYLSIDLDKIERNAAAVTGLCAQHGIAVAGVTKCVCGHPEVARAMLRGGVVSLADSRLENIERLRGGGIDARCLLLRLPPLSGAAQVVESAGWSVNSELAVLQALSRAAVQHRCVHEVMLMVDLGDLREGIWPDDLPTLVAQAVGLPGIRIVGLGSNLACFSGVVPSEHNMQRLVELAEAIEQRFVLRLDWVSGVNSSGLELIASGRMPARVNHARIGEAILLGRETIHRRPWPGTVQDAFLLHAEVLELKRKPSRPLGERGEDAFGNRPLIEDRGTMHRALLNVGRQDVQVEGLTPLDARVRIVGASSDYTVLDVTDASCALRVGDRLAFSLNYAALLAAMTSGYVKKRPLRGGEAVEHDLYPGWAQAERGDKADRP